MRVCRTITILFGLAYLVAAALFLIGVFGLFGQPRDPLSGLFLLPLGLPWNLLLDPFPDTVRPWLAVLAPAVNLGILALICRRLRH